MRTNQPRLNRILFSASLLLCGASFAHASEPAPQGPALVVPGTLPLTGPDAASGKAFQEGYELAIAQVNARGGLRIGDKRVPVALDLVDDRGDKAIAAHAAERLIDKHHASFFLGTVGGASLAAQTSVAELRHVNYLAASGASAKIFRRGFRFLFGLQTPVERMAQTELDWIAERQAAGELPRPARLSLATEATPAGAELLQAALAYAARSPKTFEVAATPRIDLDRKQPGELSQKMQMAGADVLLADAPGGSFLAVRRDAEQGACGMAIATAAASRQDRDGAAAQEGNARTTTLFQAVSWNEKLPGNSESVAFVQAFHARYHRAPEWEHALAHEAVRALVAAVEQAGSLDPEAVRGKLAGLHMASLVPGGELSFPAASGHQADYPVLLLQRAPDGSAPIVFPASAATASLDSVRGARCRQLAAAR